MSERTVTVEEAARLASEVAQKALLDVIPKILELLDDHYNESWRIALSAAETDMDAEARRE